MTCRCRGRCGACSPYARAYGGAPARRVPFGAPPAPPAPPPPSARLDMMFLLRDLGGALEMSHLADSVGRFGPVALEGGRTILDPCPSGFADMCDDFDVNMWLGAAKQWTHYAQMFRDDNLRAAFGDDPRKWPATAALGERAYQFARMLIATDPGWLDRTKVQQYAYATFFGKAALEMFVRAVEEKIFGKKDVHVDVGDALKHDPITDPKNLPMEWHPKLPDLSKYLPSWGGIGLFALAALALFFFFRNRK